MSQRLPPALPAILGLFTGKCPTVGHDSHVVCGKCHDDKLKESFGEKERALFTQIWRYFCIERGKTGAHNQMDLWMNELGMTPQEQQEIWRYLP